MNPALELNNIAVALEGTVIVQGISLQLREGMIGCLLGPSGCGKTTLLRAIAGFEKALEGEIRRPRRQQSSAVSASREAPGRHGLPGLRAVSTP